MRKSDDAKNFKQANPLTPFYRISIHETGSFKFLLIQGAGDAQQASSEETSISLRYFYVLPGPGGA